MFLQVDEHFVYFSIHIAISFKFADQELVEVLCHRRSNAPSVLRMKKTARKWMQQGTK